MKYLVKIEHTGNTAKTAKLTISSEEGGIVMSKIPVVLPSDGIDLTTLKKMTKLNVVNVESDKLFEAYDTNGTYKETVNKIRKATGGSYIGDKNRAIIKSSPTNSAIFSQDKTAIVMEDSDYKALKEILKGNSFSVEVKKVLFQFGTEKIAGQAEPDINSLLGRLNTINQHMEKEKRNVEERMKRRSEEEKSASPAQPAKSVVSNNPVQPQSNKTKNASKQKTTTSSTRSSFNNSRRDDDSDPLTTALMFAYPNMGIFLRPTSPIAWFLYFNNQVDQNRIQNEFKNIPGFENFDRCEFKETKNGYLATFYDGKEESPTCSLEFNDRDNSYAINSSDGLMTTMTYDDNNKFNITVGDEFDVGADINLVQTHDGFVGNWSTNVNNMQAESGVTISNDFDVSSTPGQLNDTRSYNYDYQPETPQVDSRSDFDNSPSFDYGREQNQNNSYDFGRDDDYIPPPPPPPRDEWNGSDPYSNGSSFSGPSF